MLKKENGSTKDAEKFFEENIERLGEVTSIEHFRNGEKAEFETIIHGKEESMQIIGGLASGYAGTGPNGLIRILKKLGVPEDKAIESVKGYRKSVHTFKFEF